MSSLANMNSSLDERPCTTNTSNQVTVNITFEEINTLEKSKHTGGVIFVSLLMVVGILGNLHVLFVYIFKTKRSTRRTFIVVLGALDFVASSVGMPFIVFDLLNPLTFDVPPVCKILRFVNYFVCTSSIFILLVIAVDRYRKVCKPLARQISRSMANYLCLGVILFSGFISWPAAVLYGSTIRGTSHPNVTGISCLIEQQFETTPYPFLFNALLLVVVFVISACLIVLYCLIWRTITAFRHSNIHIKRDDTSGNTDSIQKHFGMSPRESSRDKEAQSTSSQSENGTSDNEHNTAVYHVTMSSSSRCNDLDRKGEDALTKRSGKYLVGNQDSTTGVRSSVKPFAKIHRTTLTFCLITVVFILSYFPHLILKIVSLTKSGFFDSMSENGLFFYNTFIWCFYFNNVANAVIYGFCDNKFRQEISLFYRKLVCVCSCVCN